VIAIERTGLALAALTRYKEPTRRQLLHRSAGWVPVYAKACRGLTEELSKEHKVTTFTLSGQYSGGHDSHKAGTRRLNAGLAYVMCVGNLTNVTYSAAWEVWWGT
jgi:hypothetical protein